MYIVTGATGHTGSVVVRTLSEKGLPVRVAFETENQIEGKITIEDFAREAFR